MCLVGTLDMLHFYNTRARQMEPFQSTGTGPVGIYTCGPTVYDRAHIGNLRSYVFADVVRRLLLFKGFSVKHVVNITDVGHLTSDADTGEDKMTKALKREGEPLTLEGLRTVADTYTHFFLNDLKALNVLLPDVLPKASEHIPEQIALIAQLEERGLTYTTSDGVYFDTVRYPDYGAFGLSEETQRRVPTSPEKHSPRDFALWKFSDEIGWESPWGKGFPGWHIECSAMSMKYLGESFAIHTGGIDHIGTHHTNEIAQSEAVTGKPLAHVWLHNEFINAGREKMAKSEGTGLTLETLRERALSPLAYRYWLLTAHYRTPLSFSWGALEAAQETIVRLGRAVAALGKEGGTVADVYKERFAEALEDDLNTPAAVALMWEMLDDTTLRPEDKRATLEVFDTVFGLRILDLPEHLSGIMPVDLSSLPEEVGTLVAKRQSARQAENWSEADSLRKQINTLGFEVEDTADGVRLYKK